MSGKKILVADDEPALLNLVKIRLSLEQYEVIPASDGEEALEKALSENPDLIIMDVMMPKKDGYEVLKVLKENDKMKHIPVMIMTAANQPGDVERAASSGAADYIPKPFTSNVLLEKVRKALGD